jgi:hypothetical protein
MASQTLSWDGGRGRDRRHSLGRCFRFLSDDPRHTDDQCSFKGGAMKKKMQFSPGVLRQMRRPTRPVEGPMARRQQEQRGESPRKQGKPSALLLPMIQVAIWTMGGGIAFGLIAALLGAARFGLGLFLGSVLALFVLYSLKALTSKVVQMPGSMGMWFFHGLNIARWVVLAVVYFMLLKISVFCLLGAVTSYVWFLVVLGVIGVRSAKTPPLPTEEPKEE